MSQTLPVQRLAFSQKTKEWKEATIDAYEKLSFTSASGNRTSNQRKLINYDLFNGRFNPKDLEYVCNPLGLTDHEFPATLQHYDIISPAIMLLLGEETKRPDNFRVVAEGPDVISRKEKASQEAIVKVLEQHLMGAIDPSTIDPNNPPQTPEEVLKYMKYSYADIIETTANKSLAYLKRFLNTKNIFNKGWKDVLIAGEEIYWVGIANGEPDTRRCNPPDISVVLDDTSDYIDDAIAVIETRMLSLASILDEFGDSEDLTPAKIKKLEDISKGNFGEYGVGNNNVSFNLPSADGTDPGQGNYGNQSYGGIMQHDHMRVVRVEWQSMKKVGTYTYIDEETGEVQEAMVDETFKLEPEEVDYLKLQGIETPLVWFWINEAWEGIKIANDVYINVQPKANQRRRLDNPYYCRLGYSGHIYNATNSVSVSLIDRMKPYQYLYNIISYRLELAFASDMGKIMLMDLAQMPRSEGISIEKWMYYLKAMKIGFINSHEEGKKGARTGMISSFNQFQSIDLTLANTIQQYINTLEFIKNQVAFLSGISPQRLGSIQSSELVGNVERSVEQSSLITEYWFDSHNEVKRRVYTALIECAKIAWREGKKVQYVLDDMGIELLSIDGPEFENSEYGVFMSNSAKDTKTLDTLKSMFPQALQADKVTLSEIAKTLSTESIADLTHMLEQADEKRAAQADQAGKQQQSMQAEVLADKEKDRALKQYEIDQNNSTKIQVAEINVYSRQEELDQDGDGVPDPVEIGKLALAQQGEASKSFLEQNKLANDRDKHSKEISLKEKELKIKETLENKKIEAIRIQNDNQITLANKKAKLDKEMMDKKMQIEKMKVKAAIAKAKQKPKK